MFLGKQTRAAALLAILLVGGAVTAQSGDQERGGQVFQSNCAACHGPAGAGVPAVFPPLAGHVPEIIAAGGREYLIDVLLFGLSGPITVEGQTYNGTMPAWSSKSDEELAAVLNFVATAWGNDQLDGGEATFTAADVAAHRGAALTSSEVWEIREQLGLGAPPADGGSAEAEPEAAPAGGWFTEAQASAGASRFRSICASCHGTSLEGHIDGPALKGSFFTDYWNGKTVAELYAYARNNMPPASPGSLTDEQYADIIAFILQQNGHPSGEERLPADPAQLQRMIIGAHD